MNIYESLSDNPSFQRVMKESLVTTDIAIPEPETPDPERTGEEYRETRRPRSRDVPLRRVMKRDCNSCASHDEGWCYAFTTRTFYNIKFLKVCPLIVSSPEPEQLKLRQNDYEKPRVSLNTESPGAVSEIVSSAEPEIVSSIEVEQLQIIDQEYKENRRPWYEVPLIEMLPVEYRAEALIILESDPKARRILADCKLGVIDCWEAMTRMGIDHECTIA